MLARALALILLLASLSAGPASAWEPSSLCPEGSSRNTTFEARSEGSPLVTEIGSWRTDGRRAMLCFRGGHILGSGTTIIASWRSPFTDPSEYPNLHMDFLIDAVNPLADIRLVFEGRSQYRGGRWTDWDPWSPFVVDARAYGGGGDADVTLTPDAPARARFEWRLTLTILAPAMLDGDFVLTVPANGVRTPWW